MNLLDLLPGSQISFAREGEVIDAITVAVDQKPDNDPETNYTDLGVVDQFEPTKSESSIKLRSSRNGQPYRNRRTIMTSQEMVWNFTLQQWSEFTLAELLLNSKQPVAGAFVPNDRVESVRGWLRVETFDTLGANKILDMHVWVELSVASFQFKEGVEPYALKVEILNSDLNSGLITNI